MCRRAHKGHAGQGCVRGQGTVRLPRFCWRLVGRAGKRPPMARVCLRCWSLPHHSPRCPGAMGIARHKAPRSLCAEVMLRTAAAPGAGPMAAPGALLPGVGSGAVPAEWPPPGPKPHPEGISVFLRVSQIWPSKKKKKAHQKCKFLPPLQVQIIFPHSVARNRSSCICLLLKENKTRHPSKKERKKSNLTNSTSHWSLKSSGWSDS